MKRNMGIDLLKISSMFMIVVLHVLGQGGILKSLAIGSTRYNISWFLEIMCLCSVNCFAIISGYLNVEKKYNFKTIIYLWLEVLFYSILLIGVAKIIKPDRVNYSYITKMFFPIMAHSYWYFTAYFGLYLLMPLINMIFNKTNNRKVIFQAIFLSLCFISFGSLFGANTMWEVNGYSTIWLIFMYFIGAYIKTYKLHSKYIYRNLIMFFIFSCLTFMIRLISEKYFPNTFFIGELRYNLLNYNSPFILLASICLFIFFENLIIKNKYILKCITFFVPMSFGVYLIHTNAAIWEIFLKDAFVFCAEKTSFIYFIYLVIIIISIYLGCSIMDYIRIKLFNFLKINKFILKVDSKLRRE